MEIYHTDETNGNWSQGLRGTAAGGSSHVIILKSGAYLIDAVHKGKKD